MSEHWKSTPKYWCKHCKAYVRDTKLEKQNHDATPKHQGNIKRFLRDLHRGNEQEKRDKQRAKDEVSRLNGDTSRSGPSSASVAGGVPTRNQPATTLSGSSKPQATMEERKRQMAQLAMMGVEVPEEYRREVAMVGGWETISRKVTYEGGEDFKSNSLNIGVRKRKQVEEDDEQAEKTTERKPWGSATRKYPGAGAENEDLDMVLNNTKTSLLKGPPVKTKIELNEDSAPLTQAQFGHEEQETAMKKEEAMADSGGETIAVAIRTAHVKHEDEAAGVGVIFKKRKSKSTQQK